MMLELGLCMCAGLPIYKIYMILFLLPCEASPSLEAQFKSAGANSFLWELAMGWNLMGCRDGISELLPLKIFFLLCFVVLRPR